MAPRRARWVGPASPYELLATSTHADPAGLLSIAPEEPRRPSLEEVGERAGGVADNGLLTGRDGKRVVLRNEGWAARRVTTLVICRARQRQRRRREAA